MLPPRRLLLSALAGSVLFGGCQTDENSGCNAHGAGRNLGCPAGPAGNAHGLTAEGRVDVSAAEAFPDRVSAPPPTAADQAAACAAYAACTATAKSGAWTVLQTCLRGALSLPLDAFAVAAGERAIPFPGANETFSFFVRAVLAARGDCTAIAAVLTERADSIECQEDGCYSTAKAPVVVACKGDVATLDTGSSTSTRDCSRASARCSATSPTGCTDRPLVACTAPAKDRCDGDVKLGCDHCGFVSYHDCGWNGGRCEESPDGAKCVDAGDATSCFAMSNDCAGTTFGACVSGSPVQVDCAAFGMHCEKLSTGATPAADGKGCGLAPCEAPVCVTGGTTRDGGSGDGG